MNQNPVDGVAVAASGRVPTTPNTHSTLWWEMWRTFDAIAPTMTGPPRPHWAAIAAEYAERGFKDGLGRPPDATITRDTFKRVRKAKELQARPRLLPPCRP